MALKLQNINFSDKILRLAVIQSHERMRPLVVIETLRSVSDAGVVPFKFKLVGILRAHQAGLVWVTDIVNTTQTQTQIL